MKSPSLYRIKKITLQDVVKANYNMVLVGDELKEKLIAQQYNQLFRIVIQETNNTTRYIPEVVFVDCKNNKNYQDELDYILRNGFYINNVCYNFYGKSASMGRNGVLGFLATTVFDKVNTRAMMDIELDKTVISKFEAYKHLLLSSCFCLEEELPRMIVVDDFERSIPNVHIKYVVENEKVYTDKQTGEEKIWREKALKEGYKDITITPADGAGLCSIEIAEKWTKYLDIEYTPSIFMLRLPYVKGIVCSVDFAKFYKSKGIQYIKDIWGEEHNVDEIDIILTKSQYKGMKYFQKKKDYSDWVGYVDKLKEHNHCLGIAKWNFSSEEEPKMTQVNYQILQTLDLDKEEIFKIADYSKNHIERILDGDDIYKYLFMGVDNNSGDEGSSSNYAKAVAIAPQMINDVKVRSYFKSLLSKTIDNMKMGRLWVEGAFKIALPDIIMVMEYIAGLEAVGCLKYGEFYAKDHAGEYIINRNPHICSSEHVILNAVTNKQIEEYLSHIENICMLNSYDVTCPRLNGCDVDGDLVLVHNTAQFINGAHRDIPIVLDIEDKITAIEIEYNKQNLVEFSKRSLDSRIGEISNVATAYHNKTPNTKEQKDKYNDYVNLLSVINGKEIDYAKTGVRWNIPFSISKYAKPLPYFLKYKYDNMQTFNKSRSNLNELAWHIEKWERGLTKTRAKEDKSLVDLMIVREIEFNEVLYEQLESMYREFNSRIRQIQQEKHMIANYEQYKNYFSYVDDDGEIVYPTKAELLSTEVNISNITNIYRDRIKSLIKDQKALASYLVDISYNKHKSYSKTFAWSIAGEGIVANIKDNYDREPITIVKTSNKEGYEYLGRYYDVRRNSNV